MTDPRAERAEALLREFRDMAMADQVRFQSGKNSDVASDARFDQLREEIDAFLLAPPEPEQGAEGGALEVIKARIEKAHDTVTKLCSGELKWTMRIPADEARDPDLIIGAALRDALKLVARLQAVEPGPGDLQCLGRTTRGRRCKRDRLPGCDFCDIDHSKYFDEDLGAVLPDEEGPERRSEDYGGRVGRRGSDEHRRSRLADLLAEPGRQEPVGWMLTIVGGGREVFESREWAEHYANKIGDAADRIVPLIPAEPVPAPSEQEVNEVAQELRTLADDKGGRKMLASYRVAMRRGAEEIDRLERKKAVIFAQFKQLLVVLRALATPEDPCTRCGGSGEVNIEFESSRGVVQDGDAPCPLCSPEDGETPT